MNGCCHTSTRTRCVLVLIYLHCILVFPFAQMLMSFMRMKTWWGSWDVLLYKKLSVKFNVTLSVITCLFITRKSVGEGCILMWFNSFVDLSIFDENSLQWTSFHGSCHKNWHPFENPLTLKYYLSWFVLCCPCAIFDENS